MATGTYREVIYMRRSDAPEHRVHVEGLIEETKGKLFHTREFLENLIDGDDASRRYIQGIEETLDSNLRRLTRELY
jgi:hypothetical protein